MPLQIRPKGDPEAPAYAPHRDVAYCFPDIVVRTIKGLQSAAPDSWLMSHMYQMAALRGGCSEDEVREHLAQGCVAFAQGVRRFHQPEWGNPGEAMAEFRDLPVPVQVAVMAKVGQLFTGVFFTAIRDVTDYGQEPPRGVDLPSLIKAAEEAALSLQQPRWHGRLRNLIRRLKFW